LINFTNYFKKNNLQKTFENNQYCLPLDMLIQAIRIAIRESVLELTQGYAW